jgi:hypothetical protein
MISFYRLIASSIGYVRLFGFGYFSLSQYLKARVKKAVDFIFQFEKFSRILAKSVGLME